jgi:hypothetical protein
MTKQNYESLEEQIGAMGDVEETQTLGRLKHKSSYGQKEDLTSSEEAELDAFMARSRKHNQEQAEAVAISNGWIPIDREEMGIRSQFYPESWDFYIRPATVQAIKNWTAIDEERPDVVNNVFNDMIKTCLKIDTHSDQGATWAQINSWDRFWFVLKIREYTYANGQNKIEFEDECSECEGDVTYELTSKALFYEFPDDDLIDKYWDGSVWKIDPREYDVDHQPITLYTPKLGKDEAIIDWATAKARQDRKIDEQFIRYLIWLLPKANKDVQILDRQIQKIYKDYKNWDLDMFTFMDDVITNITINPSEKLKMTCPNCGQEAISNVQFPDGIKVLFEVKSGAKKFGSRTK